jgi:hypothetical protein
MLDTRRKCRPTPTVQDASTAAVGIRAADSKQNQHNMLTTENAFDSQLCKAPATLQAGAADKMTMLPSLPLPCVSAAYCQMYSLASYITYAAASHQQQQKCEILVLSQLSKAKSTHSFPLHSTLAPAAMRHAVQPNY